MAICPHMSTAVVKKQTIDITTPIPNAFFDNISSVGDSISSSITSAIANQEMDISLDLSTVIPPLTTNPCCPL